MDLYKLETDMASAHYDEESRIVRVTYRGVLDGEASGSVYAWLQMLFMSVGVENIYGEIFDFRDVKEFSADNLMTARQKSRTINLRMNTRRIPVSMIVKDIYQEQILRGPMKNVPENPRKRIVHSMDEAKAFLEEWHSLNTEAC